MFFFWLRNNPLDKIVVLDSLNYASNLINLKEQIDKEKIIFIKSNINDMEKVKEILTTHNISHLINFAAESHVDRSIIESKTFIETNILGTHVLLESFLEHWEKNNNNQSFRFIHISTDEVFGSLENNQNPFTENSLYSPRSPYAASKAASDHLVRAWNITYELPSLITNCSNNYGPFQFPEKLIPKVIVSSFTGSEIPLYGDGSNIRDWLFVEDHCRALELIIKLGTIGETYCIGGSNQISNKKLIADIFYIMEKLVKDLPVKPLSKLVKFVEDRKGHDSRYDIDFSKIKNDFGWEPKIKLELGLSKTIKWYLNNPSWWQTLN